MHVLRFVCAHCFNQFIIIYIALNSPPKDWMPPCIRRNLYLPVYWQVWPCIRRNLYLPVYWQVWPCIRRNLYLPVYWQVWPCIRRNLYLPVYWQVWPCIRRNLYLPVYWQVWPCIRRNLYLPVCWQVWSRVQHWDRDICRRYYGTEQGNECCRLQTQSALPHRHSQWGQLYRILPWPTLQVPVHHQCECITDFYGPPLNFQFTINVSVSLTSMACH